jgi:hypothetical protein
MDLFCADGQLSETISRFEKLDLKPNRLQRCEERCKTVEGGRRQRNINKWMAGSSNWTGQCGKKTKQQKTNWKKK